MHKSIYLDQISSEIINKLADVNLESVVLGQDLVTSENINQIKSQLSSVKIYASVNIFGAQKLQKFPDAGAVDSQGKDTKGAGVCVTHEGVRDDAMQNVKNAINEQIDGIWLEDLKYPTKWDEVEPEILDTCYCERCLRLFEEYIGEPIEGVGGEGSDLENTALYIDGSYYHEWLEFKAGYTVGFAKEVKELISASGKEIQLGMQILPWKDKDYGAGIQRVVAQDFSKLNSYIDVYSPMLYYKELGKEVSWVGEMVEYFWQLGKAFLPFVKVTEDFAQSLDYAVKSPSKGVCVVWPKEGIDQEGLSILSRL